MIDKPPYEEWEQKQSALEKSERQRVNVKASLRDSETPFRAIAEQSGEGISLADIDGNYVFVNPAFCQMTGYSQAELLEMKVLDLMPPEIETELFPRVIRGQSGKRETELVKKDGSRFYAEICGYPIRQENRRLGLGIVRDITERKRAEEALRLSEEKLQSIIDSAPFGAHMYKLKDDGKLIFSGFNLAAEKILGVKHEPFLDKPIEEAFPNLANTPIPESYRNVAESGKPYYTEQVDYDEQGIKGAFEVHAVNRGKNQMVTFFRDITERKKGEEKIRESEAKYRLIAENTADLISVLDMDMHFIYVSPASIRLRGFTVEEAMAQTLEQVLTPESMTVAISVLEEELLKDAGGTADPDRSRILELEQYKKDGSTAWMEVSLSFLRDTAGKPVQILAVTRDISDRKRAEQDLLNSEKNYRSVIENIQDVFYRSDDQGRVLMGSPSGAKMFGYDAIEEMIGLPLDHFWPDPQERQDLLAIIKEKGSARDFEAVLKRKDGSVFNATFTTHFYYDDHGQLLGTEGIIRDITDQKKAEEERQKLENKLIHAQKMESIGTLAGGIAHDFNNLLMGIQGRTSLMLADIDSYHTYYEHLKEIVAYVGSASDLTKQLLAFARGGRYEVKPTDLNKLLTKSSEMFGRTKKEVLIHRKRQKDIWTTEVDRSQIEQVLLNLFVNAWQSMPGGGELYLETENVLLDDEAVRPYSVEPGKYVKITVTDTGVGMDKRTQERIFDPFFTTKEMGRGTGLGLASAYGIIKNHNGFITVDSEKGKGAAFKIFLPGLEKEVADEKEFLEEVQTGSETVLLVDDEQMIIDVGKEMLKKIGYKVLTANSAKSAIELYSANKEEIDLVILDMVMPDMGGGETYNILKAFDPHIKVLLSSGYSVNGEATKILERGCNGFIQKPFNMFSFSQKLREILEENI